MQTSLFNAFIFRHKYGSNLESFKTNTMRTANNALLMQLVVSCYHCWLYYNYSLKIIRPKLRIWIISHSSLKRSTREQNNIFYWSRVIHCCYIITVLVTSFDTARPSYHHGFTRSKAALIRSIQHRLFPCTMRASYCHGQASTECKRSEDTLL